jgi:uncharacterized protein YjbI with pentapeptide repeats
MADNNSEAEPTEIPACIILNMIQDGEPVIYDHVRIIGNLDLRKLNLPMEKVTRTEYQISELHLPEECKVITSSIMITNSEFEDPSVVASNTDFDNCLFKSQINFENSSFDYANFRGATFDGDVTFKGATFSEANFVGATFRGSAVFEETMFLFVDKKFGRLQIEGIRYERVFHGLFTGAIFTGLAIFSKAKFSEDADFSKAKFLWSAFYMSATFSRLANFSEATFNYDADFLGATFSGDADFSEANNSMPSALRLRYGADFSKAKFSSKAKFTGAIFRGIVKFEGAKGEGDYFTFRDATFMLPDSQEEACRKAKNVLAKAGNREEEEYHFYREMEAKRIRKGIQGNSGLGLGYLLTKTETWSAKRFFGYDVIEYIFVQTIFRYGTDPYWLFGWWLGFVVFFAVIYSVKGGIEEPEVRQWYDYFWFSVATAATPGYALYKPMGMFKFIAGIEAILGTFMWAAFITTFARKFSR